MSRPTDPAHQPQPAAEHPRSLGASGGARPGPQAEPPDVTVQSFSIKPDYRAIGRAIVEAAYHRGDLASDEVSPEDRAEPVERE